MDRKLRWSGEMTNALLEHLENNKGVTGLYETDRQAASQDGVKFLAARCPSENVTTRQLLGKIAKLWQRHRRPDVPSNSSLWLEGRGALTSDFNQRSLLHQGYDTRVEQLRKGPESKASTSDRGLRARSTAHKTSGHAPNNRNR